MTRPAQGGSATVTGGQPCLHVGMFSGHPGSAVVVDSQARRWQNVGRGPAKVTPGKPSHWAERHRSARAYLQRQTSTGSVVPGMHYDIIVVVARAADGRRRGPGRDGRDRATWPESYPIHILWSDLIRAPLRSGWIRGAPCCGALPEEKMRELAIRWINLRKRGVTLGEPRGKRGIAHCHQGRTPQARSAENHPARRRRGGIGERRDRQHDELPCRRALLASQNRPGIGSAPTSREPVLSRFSSPRTQRPKAIRARWITLVDAAEPPGCSGAHEAPPREGAPCQRQARTWFDATSHASPRSGQAEGLAAPPRPRHSHSRRRVQRQSVTRK